MIVLTSLALARSISCRLGNRIGSERSRRSDKKDTFGHAQALI